VKKRLFLTASTLAVLALMSSGTMAQDNTFKIGLVLPMTGQQATTGRQIEAAARLYMAQNGDTVTTPACLTSPSVWRQSWWSTTRSMC
jgi:branched-chain amino acid transport system substrate-binding protein